MRHTFLSVLRFLGLSALTACLGVLLLLGAWFASRPSEEARAESMLLAQAAEWEDPTRRAASIRALRSGNPEFDLMRRTFLALSASERALSHPDEADRWLALVDSLIATTEADLAAGGHRHFLLGYADAKPWVDPTERSLFVDGELALMLGARRMVRDDPEVAAAHRARVADVVRAFEASPAGLPESYPDEAWLFCVTHALVAVRLADLLDGTDHDALVTAFTDQARRDLTHGSGLLGSEFRTDRSMLDGPEGSSLWAVATNLRLLDEELADEQYAGAVEALSHEWLGLGWASEWGPGWRGAVDIDSGPIIPLLDASPSSSGFALMASRAFGDERRHRRLVRALAVPDLVLWVWPALAESPEWAMGQAVLLRGLMIGPLWEAAALGPGATGTHSLRPPPRTHRAGLPG